MIIIALLFGFSMMSYFDRTIMSIAGPTIMKEFSISETAMGTVYSAFLLSYMILMTPGGWIADRFGRRPAENGLRVRVPRLDDTVAIHHHDRVEHGVQDRCKDRFDRHMWLKNFLFAR